MKDIYEPQDFKFGNLEFIYEELLLRGLLQTIDAKDRISLHLLYHLYMYARYFSSDISTVSIMEPFVQTVLKKLKAYESSTLTKRIKHKKRLLIFSASQKIMIGLKQMLLNSTHEVVFDLLNSYLGNDQHAKNEDNHHKKGIAIEGSSIIIEIYKSSGPAKEIHPGRKELEKNDLEEDITVKADLKGN
jgi:hypothetical protein